MNLIRRVFALTAAAAMAVLVPVTISACGSASAPTTNGLEQKSPADVLQEAAAALKAATSVHIAGTGSDGRIDARIQHDDAAGTLTKDGHEIRITIIGSDGYFYTDQAGLEMMGVPAEVQPQVAGQWVKTSASNFTGFTFADLASQLTAYRGPLEPKVSQATLDGRQAVVVSWQDGSKLYVANTGPAYPLHGDIKEPQAGQIDYTEYGAHFQITAPANAIDLSPTPTATATATATAPAATTPTPAISGPMTGQELLWLQAVEQLLPTMNKVFASAPASLTSSALASLADQVRGCSRELARIGPPPGARLQPVYELVQQACQAYDKGAQCFEDAARMGIPSSPAAEQKFEQKLNCGFAASGTGSEPLAQAQVKASEIKAVAG